METMKKTNDNPKTQQASIVDELLKNGTTTLTSLTREDFDAMLADIPADVKYGAGAIGRNSETGLLSLRIDLIK